MGRFKFQIISLYNTMIMCGEVIIVLSMCTDYIDIVADNVPHSEYKEEEDPRKYKSKKSGRGPLGDNWRSQNAVMCIYKLCKVSDYVCVCGCV